jgi:hypothetical protein
MSLPSTIDVAFVNQYQSMLYVLSQQQKSKFASKVRNEQVTGESKAFDRLGEAEVEEITTRYPDTPNNEQPHSRRWVTPSNYHTNSYIDTVDKLKMIINPQSEYQQNQGRALGRQTDDLIITAALGSAATGNTPTTSSVDFKDESVSINGDGTITTLGTLATAAGSGSVADMGLNKILTMLRIFHDEDVDEEIPLYWAVTPKSVEDLLNVTEIGSIDYNTVKALAEGKVERYSGFNFFWTTRLNKDAASETAYRSIAWAQDGIIWGSSQSVVSHIDERTDKSYTIQVYSKMNGNAVRMDGDKVHECLNKVA